MDDSLVDPPPQTRSAQPDPAANLEPDTCRICRGEATPQEPLFYPCKCSGSIKYVHQDCLMEWLSHSQKKHCELCKTSFRFTKLYSPTMPKQVPVFVFAKHMTRYFIRKVLVWLRVALVIFVWAVVLPIFTRWEWSFFFWVSEEGLQSAAPESITSLLSAAAPKDGNATQPAVVPGSNNTTNNSSSEGSSLILFVASTFLDMIGVSDPGPAASAAEAETSSFGLVGTVPPTLLSEVAFLNSLTRSRKVNSLVIYALEGLFITFLVVVCFILLILVRDYVVQQQPEINMRAAFGDDADVDGGAVNDVPFGPADGPLDEVDHHHHHHHHHHHDHHHHNHHHHNDHGNWEDELGDSDWETDDSLGSEEIEILVGHLPRPAAAQPVVPHDTDEDGHATTHDVPPRSSTPGPFPELWEDTTAQQQQRQHQPDHDQDHDHDHDSVESSSSTTTMDLADLVATGETRHLLQLQQALDRQELDRQERQQQQWWRQRQERHQQELQPPPAVTTTDEAVAGPVEDSSSSSSSSREKEPADVPSADDAPDADAADESANHEPEAEPKPATSAFGEFEYGLRPRANTDGPIGVFGPNPLGSNNWSFLPAQHANDTAPGGDAVTGAAEGDEAQPAAGAANATEATESAEAAEAAEGAETAEAADVTADAPDVDTHDAPEIETEIENPPAPAEAAHRPVDAHPPPPPQQQQQRPPGNLLGMVANFMWRDLDNIDPADLPPIPILQDDDGHDGLFGDDDDDDDPNVPLDEAEREAFEAAAAAAAAANIEAEAIEDAEDLDGILELLGMRGPLMGLFQNVMFCAFLVTVSLLIGIFLPYNIGRFSIWLMVNPKHPMTTLFSLAKLLQDAAAAVLGVAAFGAVYLLQGPALFVQAVVGWSAPADVVASSMATAWDILAAATVRVGGNFEFDAMLLPAGEIRNFSAISHQALFTLKAQAASAAMAVGRGVLMAMDGDFARLGAALAGLGGAAWAEAWAVLRELPVVLSDPSSWVITLGPTDAASVNPAFAYWGGPDRFLAIWVGYVTVFVVAWWYLNKGAPLTVGGEQWEVSVMEGLKQAGGVLKVILIIGIEMLVFPLYCGLLLDVALLPLFPGTTVMSRVLFAVHYPTTAVFVHWFVGTGYMFHFALFVSMCRKIMRKGVLYFIRDPDDPDFHPVRDVLERNVTTQLRKILFSACVYGGLVIVCLGGVVWGLAYVAAGGILPIHHASNQPVLEFPIDLMFYNFLMPYAVKHLKPGDALHAMYTWWFRKAGRLLRLTWYLFGERRIDEEGDLVLAPDSPYRRLPWPARLFLVYDRASATVHPAWTDPPPRPWAPSPLLPPTIDVHAELPWVAEDAAVASGVPGQVRKLKLVRSRQLVPSGHFVRAPSSDQAKIPKDGAVFYRVSELDEGLRPAASAADMAIYNSADYQMVYIPPHFRARIFCFILCIWVFAATTGVALTIVPLLFGRALFRYLLPPGVETNDIYAFSIGLYVLSAAAYLLFHVGPVVRNALSAVRRTVTASSSSSSSSTSSMKLPLQLVARTAKIVYSYVFILGIFPMLASSLVELYIQIPLHTYMHPPPPLSSSTPSSATPDPSRHTVYLVQSWTLGLLFLKVATRSITGMYPDSRLASAIRAVLRRGALDPDARLLTRAFVVPGFVLAVAAVVLPWAVANAYLACESSAGVLTALAAYVPLALPSLDDPRNVYRLSYPCTAALVALLYALRGGLGVFAQWKVRIRDEVYLIGERLHNLGPPTAPPGGARRGYRGRQ